MRLVVLTNIVPPYRVPVFNALADELGDDFSVLCLARTEANRDWTLRRDAFRFRYDILPALHLRGRRPDRTVHLTGTLALKLAQLRPDVLVVGGFDQPPFLEALALAPWLRYRPVLWSGGHLESARGGRVLVIKRWAVRRAKAFLTYGTAATDYLLSLGAPAERIVTSRNAVDVSAFHREGHEVEAAALRQRLEVGDRPVALYVGQLIARKGVDTLIEAVARVPELQLVLVGAGPDRKALEEKAAALLPGRTHFAGSVPYAELPSWYAAADLLVMPSRLEVWGLVLNEAMAAGLPVISSQTAGATRDLVTDGINGFAVDPDDVAAMADRLGRLAHDPEFRRRAGAASAARIAEVTPARYARDFLAAAALASKER